jgi:hypothetical protein
MVVRHPCAEMGGLEIRGRVAGRVERGAQARTRAAQPDGERRRPAPGATRGSRRQATANVSATTSSTASRSTRRAAQTRIAGAYRSYSSERSGGV